MFFCKHFKINLKKQMYNTPNKKFLLYIYIEKLDSIIMFSLFEFKVKKSDFYV